METRISVRDAAGRFTAIVDQVGRTGEEFVVEDGGRAVCRISPVRRGRFTVGNMVALLRSLPRPDAEFLEQVEAVARHQPEMPKVAWD